MLWLHPGPILLCARRDTGNLMFFFIIAKNKNSTLLSFLCRPFSGKYLRKKDEGIYTCLVCDNPLFNSEDKFDTHCGWPAFSDVIAQGKVTVKKDFSAG